MRAVALLLAVVLLPGVSEATEDFAHWVLQGHTVHASVEEHTATGEEVPSEGHATDEHGCSALFHLCGCHAPAPSVVTARVSLDRSDVPLVEPTILFQYASRRAPDGVSGDAFRPPIV